MVPVSVIVPARNAADTIERTLAGIAGQVDVPHEVIVVDDGSTDGTAELAERAPGAPVVLRAAGSAGAGAARNRGAHRARGEVLAFTDADCEPQPGWLAAGLAACAAADLVQGRVRPDPAVRRGPFDRTLRVDGPSGFFETANLFVRREWFERLDGFGSGTRSVGDRQAARPFGEDTEFGWRARRAGARTAFAPDAVVDHAVFPRSPREYVAERARLRHFPGLVGQIPEWRDHVLHRRLFLSPRSAALDLALTGLLAASVCPGPRGGRLLIAGAATVPYARRLVERTDRAFPLMRPFVAAVDLVADLRGFAALVAGSVEHRHAVL